MAREPTAAHTHERVDILAAVAFFPLCRELRHFPKGCTRKALYPKQTRFWVPLPKHFVGFLRWSQRGWSRRNAPSCRSVGQGHRWNTLKKKIQMIWEGEASPDLHEYGIYPMDIHRNSKPEISLLHMTKWTTWTVPHSESFRNTSTNKAPAQQRSNPLQGKGVLFSITVLSTSQLDNQI